jgi:hypothetical protein
LFGIQTYTVSLNPHELRANRTSPPLGSWMDRSHHRPRRGDGQGGEFLRSLGRPSSQSHCSHIILHGCALMRGYMVVHCIRRGASTATSALHATTTLLASQTSVVAVASCRWKSKLSVSVSIKRRGWGERDGRNATRADRAGGASRQAVNKRQGREARRKRSVHVYG